MIGGQAFPRATPGYDGMTLRDYFAAQALTITLHGNPYPVAVRGAYEIADAMLAERQKEQS
jgi:hypothetical protein